MTRRHSEPLRLSAVVIGGGIGGLTAANALLRRGIDVTVFEQAPTLREVGAGLGLFPNSLRLFERMGLGEDLSRDGVPIGPDSQMRRKDGTPVTAIVRTDSTGRYTTHFAHRADLLNILSRHLPPDTVRIGYKCIDFSQTPDVARVKFANGETVEADLVIAADGIRSELQRFVVPPSPPVYSGARAYRGLVSRQEVGDWPDGTHQIWMGEGKHFMVFPVRRGSLLNYVGFVPTDTETVESWSAIGDRDELAASFAGWNPDITRLLEKVQSCFWWGLYDRTPLARWSNGRLALLGDAAHPMLPHVGQGANQAIEDAVALAVLLEGRRSDDVVEALQSYEQLRRKRTDIVQAETRRNGLRYDSRFDNLEERDRELREHARFRLWLFDHDAEEAALTLRQSQVF